MNVKKSIFVILNVLLFLNVSKAQSHDFYFGVNPYKYRISTHVDEVKVNGNLFFWGVQFGYEYKKPSCIYFGADIFGSISENGKVLHCVIPSENKLVEMVNGLGFDGGEIRLGYVFDQCSYLITPFLSVGFYSFDRIRYLHDFRYNDDYQYFGGGFIIDYCLNPYLDIGLKAKSLFIGREATVHFFEHTYKKDSYECGLEVAVPLTFHLCKNKHWNIKLEPYFLTLSLREENFVYGSKFFLEYSF